MQLTLAGVLPPVEHAYDYGLRSDGEAHGVVLTKPHVVELILDLVGYTHVADLPRLRLLEPACGEGVFLLAAAERLLSAARRRKVGFEALAPCLVSFDIEPAHVSETRRALLKVLRAHGAPDALAKRLCKAWVREADFLLADDLGKFDFIVGNPPYVRIEQISAELSLEYRRRYSALFDRADLYVAFIQRGLELLSPKGLLGFICADRWTLNRYGEPLRRFITASYDVRAYVDLHQASPFESDVIAYPSIFVFAAGPQQFPVPVVSLQTATPSECAEVPRLVQKAFARKRPSNKCRWYPEWFRDDEPWVLSSPEHLAVLRQLERDFPLLEADGTTLVRIGVATGCDRVFIVPDTEDIEADRLLPLVKREDITEGTIAPGCRSVINTFEDESALDLDRYPRLRRYLEAHRAEVAARHVAQKNPRGWFRTIDRVYPELAKRPKLLIPDIAGSNEVVFEPGHYYPHHNLYFVISASWDLEVLGALLSSRVALFFVWSYAVKMRGGYLRFQAQYLRKIRVPNPASIPPKLANALKSAFRKRDFKSIDALALTAYGLTELAPFDFVDTRN